MGALSATVGVGVASIEARSVGRGLKLMAEAVGEGPLLGARLVVPTAKPTVVDMATAPAETTNICHLATFTATITIAFRLG